MNDSTDFVLYDALNNKINYGTFTGSIISKCQDKIIFSDNFTISESGEISISQGLVVGFENNDKKPSAFSKTTNFSWEHSEEIPLEYALRISENIMEQYNKEQFPFPFTISLCHTAGLYLNNDIGEIDHLDFFKNEILKNPVSLMEKGIIMADKVVINENGDPVFYDCIIVGRDEKDEIKASYEFFVNVDDKDVLFIIILGIEELKE
ncbi:MAG: hypothetical protein KGD65_09290 [Candidatus Lokiarchaeota archaeon]|nr:hypothetical protein [Candidatus Lokiarchaeota archaeon]